MPHTTGAAELAPRMETGEPGAEPTPGRPQPWETAGDVGPDSQISNPAYSDISRAYETSSRRVRLE